MAAAGTHFGVEEQSLPRYGEKRYYPVRPGQVLQGRYRAVAKLGFGAYSTVWLGLDQRTNRYVSLKICVQDSTEKSPTTNEIKILERLRQCATASEHPGRAFTRLATDIFQIDGTHGRHDCIVMEPQGCSLRMLQESVDDAKLPKALVKSLIHRLLFAISWLHVECGLIHTVDSDATFKAIEESESQEPSLATKDGDYTIYQSINAIGPMTGIPILTDFGQTRAASPEPKDWWMPDLYRAPEVLLGLPWSCPVDIWSLGILTIELLEGRSLFDPIDYVNNQYVLPLALAQYIGVLGHPPLQMISQNPQIATHFDFEGKWISEPPIPVTSLEDFVTVIPPGREKDQFLRCVRKMLTWDPAVRIGPLEMVPDEWLMATYEEADGVAPVPFD